LEFPSVLFGLQIKVKVSYFDELGKDFA